MARVRRVLWRVFAVLVAMWLVSGLMQLSSTSGSLHDRQGEVCSRQHTANLSTTFPRILHQVWLQGGELPYRYKRNTLSCKGMYSHYEYRMWDNEDIEKFISEHYPALLPVYRSYPYYVQRTDCARYLIMHHYGGLYVDADVHCHQPIDAFLANLTKTFPKRQLIAKVGNTRTLGTELMIAKAGSGVLSHLKQHLAEYSTVNYFFNYPTVMYSTGPGFYGNMYRSYECPEQVHLVTHELNRFFTHGCYAQWQAWDGKLINKIHYRWKSYCAGALGVILALFLLYRCIKSRLSCRKVPKTLVKVDSLGYLKKQSII